MPSPETSAAPAGGTERPPIRPPQLKPEPSDSEPSRPTGVDPLPLPSVAEGVLELFFGRTDRFGRQLPEKQDAKGKLVTGPWQNERKTDGVKEKDYPPITAKIIERHLAGELFDRGQVARLIAYQTSEDSQSVATAIDLDIIECGHADTPEHFPTDAEAMDAALRLRALIHELGLTPFVERTKGGSLRVWIFHHRLPAADAKDLGLLLSKRAGLHPKTEIYPEQATTPGKTGSGLQVPYWGKAGPGRQSFFDPDTGEVFSAEAFARLALAARSDPQAVAALVAQARASGELAKPAAARPKREADGQGVEALADSQAGRVWQQTLAKCRALAGLVETCKAGGQISYGDWLHLASHLRPAFYGDPDKGGWGRSEFHRLSALDSRYDAAETDRLWDSLTGGPALCANMGCGRDPQRDCGMQAGKGSAVYFGWKEMRRLKMATERRASAEGLEGGERSEGETPGISPIPPPNAKDSNGKPEYAPYQIAAFLGLSSELPDTEAAQASRAINVYGETLCYCKGLGWLQWNGKYWQVDDPKNNAATIALFVKLAKQVRQEAAQLFGLVKMLLETGREADAAAMERAAFAHRKHIAKCEAARFAREAVLLATDALTKPVELFLPRAYLVGFDNGVWDHGTWREHRRTDYFTHLCPVTVDSASVSETGVGEWGELLYRITGDDTNFARTLQEVAGYALSGASSLRTIAWTYGPGGTGKSTFAELLLTVLGDGATTVGLEHFTRDAERAKLGAVLIGKRLAVVAEAGNAPMQAGQLKALSGSDAMPVKRLYLQEFHTRSTHALLLAANDPPRMDAYDEQLKKRVLALPFTRALDDGPHLKFTGGNRLEEVRNNPNSPLVQQFAQWALSGLARIYEAGQIYRAPMTERATAKLFAEMDDLTAFWEQLDEAVVAHLRRGMEGQRLKDIYREWCSREGLHPLGVQRWAKACRAAGLTEVRLLTVRGWRLEKEWVYYGEDTATQNQDFSPFHTSNPISNKVYKEIEEPKGGLAKSSKICENVKPIETFPVPIERVGKGIRI